jgi:hypothetical protein
MKPRNSESSVDLSEMYTHICMLLSHITNHTEDRRNGKMSHCFTVVDSTNFLIDVLDHDITYIKKGTQYQARTINSTKEVLHRYPACIVSIKPTTVFKDIETFTF